MFVFVVYLLSNCFYLFVFYEIYFFGYCLLTLFNITLICKFFGAQEGF
ncbi:hypothetical protein HMPREF9711_02627 [Myroides odoratimimus CCUG 3837]|nr:hypothetical protein HMPREF9711_02627 [Myroides odoratimimus CCUG 3837]